MHKIYYGFLYSLFMFVSCNDDVQDKMYADSDNYVSKQTRSSKRGIGFGTMYEADIAAIEKGVSWAYNWAAAGYNQTIDPSASRAELLYIPMIWNGNGNWETQIRNLKKSHPECEYILAFNEPNLRDQANMTPSDAAAKWPPLKALANELNMKIVAPAMNYGTLTGYSDPIKWLDEFFAQPGVSIDDIAALSIHCYMRVPSALKSYVERFRKYGKPVWMTEFCAWEGSVSVEQQQIYMSDVVNYMEAEPLIERYAWFMYDGPKKKDANYPNYALRELNIRSGELTDLGKIYVYMSSLDKELYYTHNQVIPSEHYSNSNMSEAVGAENASKQLSSVRVKVSTDTTGILEVSNFGLPKWLEYNITPNVKGDYHLIIRYASNGDSKCKIHINNTEVAEIDLPKTGGYTEWATITTPVVPLDAGKQIIRFTPSKGMVSMNWWRYKRQQ